MPKYSICITQRNNRATVEASLRSVLDQIDDNFEVVVVDSESSDGSQEVLRRFAHDGAIKLVEQRCTRGKGRQIAFENSHGAIVVSNIDMDEVYSPRLVALLEAYDRLAEGRVLLALSSILDEEHGRQNITIAPRELLRSLGGWHDVNYGEDWDLWRRAAEREKFAVLVFQVVTGPDPSAGRPRLRSRYTRYLAMIQLGREVFAESEEVHPSQRALYLWARFVSLFKPRFNGPKKFDPYQQKYLIRSE